MSFPVVASRDTWQRVFLAMLVLPVLLGGGISSGADDPRQKADPDSTGSLPKSVTPQAPNGPTHPIKTPTLGCVLDATTHQPIVSALLVVTSPTGQVAGLALTDGDGIFVVYLFDTPGLELAIPSEGMAGLSIEAGDVLTILVP